MKNGVAAVTEGGCIQLTQSPGDAIFSLAQYQMNGSLVGSSNEPAIDGVVLKRVFMKYEVNGTYGDLQYLNQGVIPLGSSYLDIVWTPSLGLWATDSIGGASHVLSMTTHANLIERLIRNSGARGLPLAINILGVK